MERFEAEVERRGRGVVLEVPSDVKAAFGRARAPVRATVNGYEVRTTVASYGGRFYIGLNTEVRAAAGVDVGDRVAVALELDAAPREVGVPEDLAAALHADALVRDRFNMLSYTHRREYVEWIEEAKRGDTRARRLARAVEMLREGIRTPG